MAATSLYIHIPFCESICPYCDFCKVIKSPRYEQGFVRALLFDLSKLEGRKFQTIYIGGGTPSCLEISSLEALSKAISPLLEEGGEFTFEANPESLTEDKVASLADFGVNRVSLGAQSASRKYLSFLGRHHDFEAVRKSVSLLREAGIDNINLDLMYGFPDQALGEVKEDVEALLSLSPSHISTYSLILEKGTVFANKGIAEADEDFLADCFEEIGRLLKGKGYLHYEVSNYAKPDRESRHNLVYWRDQEYIGLGPGASGYEEGIRYKNTFSVPRYIEGVRRVEEEKVDKESDRLYYLLTHLRLAEGFSLKEFESRFEEDILSSRKEAIDKHLGLGRLVLDKGRLAVKESALIVLDSILVDLL